MEGDSRKPNEGWSDPLWERQGTESDRAFEAFAIYRDMGPGRSAVRVGEALSKSTRLIARWSTEWGWVERAGAWDDEADRNERERNLTERAIARQKMLESHAALGKTITVISAGVLAQFGEKNPGAAAKLGKMSAVDAAKLAQIGSQMERLARGETTERVELKQAQEVVEGLIDVCLRYLPIEMHEAFLVDIDAQLGVGGMSLG